ncbi:MAG TPA: division/cell wall cluster transcriptional repressor MraZ, partial [Longimicrobium sp.]|jgi:MraZ protein|nr:division/cell wall cluster transcriptional repressor MraZ [Longimicrobium sp.]
MEQRLREMLRRNPKARPYVLKVTANAVEVVPDKQGRILVPQRMQKEVGITGPTLVVGAIDRIELWNPETFDALTAQEVPEVALLAHEIFG